MEGMANYYCSVIVIREEWSRERESVWEGVRERKWGRVEGSEQLVSEIYSNTLDSHDAKFNACGRHARTCRYTYVRTYADRCMHTYIHTSNLNWIQADADSENEGGWEEGEEWARMRQMEGRGEGECSEVKPYQFKKVYVPVRAQIKNEGLCVT